MSTDLIIRETGESAFDDGSLLIGEPRCVDGTPPVYSVCPILRRSLAPSLNPRTHANSQRESPKGVFMSPVSPVQARQIHATQRFRGPRSCPDRLCSGHDSANRDSVW
jgi:hypothetical protein